MFLYNIYLLYAGAAAVQQTRPTRHDSRGGRCGGFGRVGFLEKYTRRLPPGSRELSESILFRFIQH